MGLPIRRLIARHQRERRARRVLPQPASTVRAAPPRRTHTSSPSMDISKASNFERFVFDVVGRDPAVVRALWQRGRPRRRLRPLGHAVRRATSPPRASCRDRAPTPTASRPSATSHAQYGVVVDPHTADGIKVGLRAPRGRRAAGVHRDRAAGQVRGDDPRGARARPRAPVRVRRPRAAAAALRAAAGRRGASEGVHRRPRVNPAGAPRAFVERGPVAAASPDAR